MKNCPVCYWTQTQNKVQVKDIKEENTVRMSQMQTDVQTMCLDMF